MKALRPLGCAFVLASLASCGDSGSGAAAPAAAEAPKAKVETNAAPAAAAEYVYQYNPVNKRDPFHSLIRGGDEAVASNQTGRTLCPDPLCQWELDQLTLVAVVTGDANPIAMVEDPSGRGHIVKRNTRMGKQDGRVTMILRDSLVVTEYWQGPDGKIKPNPSTIKLKNDVAAVPPVDMLTGQPYQ